MVTYLVCVDESDNSKAAFYTTVNLKERRKFLSFFFFFELVINDECR